LDNRIATAHHFDRDGADVAIKLLVEISFREDGGTCKAMSEICIVEAAQGRVRPGRPQILGHRRADITHVSSNQYLHVPISLTNLSVPL
jgi:hypothetical protein